MKTAFSGIAHGWTTALGNAQRLQNGFRVLGWQPGWKVAPWVRCLRSGKRFIEIEHICSSRRRDPCCSFCLSAKTTRSTGVIPPDRDLVEFPDLRRRHAVLLP